MHYNPNGILRGPLVVGQTVFFIMQGMLIEYAQLCQLGPGYIIYDTLYILTQLIHIVYTI